MRFSLFPEYNEMKLYSEKGSLLSILLADRTTRKNIIWATADYSRLGAEYAPEAEILPHLITGENDALIQPRTAKAKAEQDNRTRDKAEVYTPCWVCNAQNNLVDEAWFGRPDVFNTPDGTDWSDSAGKILFEQTGFRTWQKYVHAKRLEITCGEGPYLTSRYDPVTGEPIPLRHRIGLLDRKLRVVSENTRTEEEWNDWALRALQSCYGYEYLGDSLLIARVNMLNTFLEYHDAMFHRAPPVKVLKDAARFISWNLWQMDGLKFVTPFSCHEYLPEPDAQYAMADFTEPPKPLPCPGCRSGDNHRHNGIYPKVTDWRGQDSFRYIDLVKGGN